MDLQPILNNIPDSQVSTQSWDSQNASTQSWDSQNGPRPPEAPQTPQKERSLCTTRTDRIRIKTALDFGIPHALIRERYGYTEHQIQWARRAQLTPQRNKCGRRPKISTPRRRRL